MESIFHRLFNDSILSERMYSFVMWLMNGWMVTKIWQELKPKSKLKMSLTDSQTVPAIVASYRWLTKLKEAPSLTKSPLIDYLTSSGSKIIPVVLSITYIVGVVYKVRRSI